MLAFDLMKFAVAFDFRLNAVNFSQTEVLIRLINDLLLPTQQLIR